MGLLIAVTVFLLTESGVSTLWGLLPVQNRSVSGSIILAGCGEAARAYGLTPREEEVLTYLVRGKSVADTALALVVSEATVRTHIKRIYAKLDVHSRAEMMSLICFPASDESLR